MKEIYDILKSVRSEFDFEESENFVEDGFLDSFDIINIISIIEEQYNIEIDGLDVVPENFYCAESIAKLIEKSGGKLGN